MQPTTVFRGRFAIALAFSALLGALGFAVTEYLGGMPEHPEAARFFLKDHGDRTEVTHVAWIVASVGQMVFFVSLFAGFVSLLGCITQTIAYWDNDPRKDHSLLVAISVVSAFLLSVAANILAAVAPWN